MTRNVIGFGVLDENNMLAFMNNEVMLTSVGNIKVKEEQPIEISMPKWYKSPTSDPDSNFKVSITCVSRPRIDHSKGNLCVRTRVKIATNEKSKIDGSNLNVWSSVYKCDYTIKELNDNKWKVRIQAESRDDDVNEQLRYALVITITDPKNRDLQKHMNDLGYLKFTSLRDIETSKVNNKKVRVG